MPDLCDCFIFDPLWWKDYGIPLLEAVAIPLLVWFLTWYYGAEKAEERKEKRELRDNLNMLLSVCLSNIIKLIRHRNELIKIHNLETVERKMDIDTILQEVSKIYCVKNDFDVIDIAKYSSCIAVSENYMMNLITVKNAMELQIAKINHRNEDLKKITNNESVAVRKRFMMEFIELDAIAFTNDIEYLEQTLLSLYGLIKGTKDLEKKIKGLKLDEIKYSEEQKQLFAELEQKYAKEQEK